MTCRSATYPVLLYSALLASRGTHDIGFRLADYDELAGLRKHPWPDDYFNQ
ncbi:hypothetical protein [Oxalobacter paraformigenes]|uniref:hypothetical protein n=1 Tax=Oxalobacter paraformigenes TaxID=556268 RepID=UPI001C9CBB5C|nr:hypothetical protein [Oxalobacter paraformigenes]